MGGAHAGELRVLGQAVPEVHAPADVQGAAGRRHCRRRPSANSAPARRAGRPNDADLDEFRRGIDPLASSGRLGALLAQFPASFKDATVVARLPRRSASRVRRLSGRRRAASSKLERRDRRDARAPEHVRRRLGADRRAEVPLLDPAELPAERRRASTTCACTAGTPTKWWRHEKSEDRYDYLYSADELKEFSDTADAAEAAGQEALSLHQQSLLGEVGRQRRDDQAAARRADRRRVPARVHRALPGAGRGAHSFTDIFLITSPRSRRAGTSSPAITCPKTVYLPFRSGRSASVT